MDERGRTRRAGGRLALVWAGGGTRARTPFVRLTTVPPHLHYALALPLISTVLEAVGSAYPLVITPNQRCRRAI